MNWTVAGMTQSEYFRGPFWVTLPHSPGARPVILGISNDYGEQLDYEMLSNKFGAYFQFFLLNEDALKAVNAANMQLKILGSIEYEDLSTQPSLLLGTRPVRRLA